MSLQVWLPLNGNIENQGICDTISISSGTPQYTTGKIGQGISLNQRVSLTGLPKLNKFSIIFWAKVDSCKVNWSDLIGFTSKQSDDSSAAEFRFEATIDSRACSWHNNSPYAISTNSRILIQNYSEWHHVGVVYNGEKIYSYIDGNLTYTDTGLGGYLTTNFHIGETGNIVGAMSDLRIYDTTLSKNEIKNIYNTCILHYSFNDGFINDNLIVEGNNINSWTTEGCTKAEFLDEDLGKCLKITSSSANGRVYRTVNDVWTTKGETFTVSFWAKSSENGVTIDASRSISDFSQKFSLITEWRRYVGHITTTNISSTGTLSIRINTSGKTIYITDIKLERGKINTNWSPNVSDSLYEQLEFDSTTVFDESGYKFDGIQSKELPLSSDSALGIKSLDLTGTDYESYIRVPNYPQFEKDFTWNAWVKQNDKALPKTLQTVLSQGRDYVGNTTSGADCGFNIFISNGIPEIRYGNWAESKNGNRLLTSNTTIDNEWHMITASINKDGIGKIYIDGELKNTALNETTCSYSQANGNLVIGKMSYQYSSTNQFFPFNGLIDDIKLFAHTLSDEDIEKMYNVKMTLDKGKNLETNNLIEYRQNSFYFNLDKMGGTNDSILEVVNCSAKSIRLKFKQTPPTWQYKYFPLEEFIEDGKTYMVYMKPNENCNKNLADGTDNQYGRTYGSVGIHKYKISDNSVVKLEWSLKNLELYIGKFVVDYSTYKNYQLKIFPNCVDTTSWDNGDYIYDYIDIVPIEEDYNTNISKKGCFTTGEFLEQDNLSELKIEKYNRTNINQIIET